MEEANLETFIEICQRFNQKAVKYVVCGAYTETLRDWTRWICRGIMV